MDAITGEALYTRARDTGAADWAALDATGKAVWRRVELQLSHELGQLTVDRPEPEVRITGTDGRDTNIIVHGRRLECVTRADWSVIAGGVGKAVLYVDNVAVEAAASLRDVEIVRRYGRPEPSRALRRLLDRARYRKVYALAAERRQREAGAVR